MKFLQKVVSVTPIVVSSSNVELRHLLTWTTLLPLGSSHSQCCQVIQHILLKSLEIDSSELWWLFDGQHHLLRQVRSQKGTTCVEAHVPNTRLVKDPNGLLKGESPMLLDADPPVDPKGFMNTHEVEEPPKFYFISCAIRRLENNEEDIVEGLVCWSRWKRLQSSSFPRAKIVFELREIRLHRHEDLQVQSKTKMKTIIKPSRGNVLFLQDEICHGRILGSGVSSLKDKMDSFRRQQHHRP